MSWKRLNLSWATATAALMGACGTADRAELESFGSLEYALRVTVPAKIEAENYERYYETTPTTNSGAQCDRADGVDKETAVDSGGGCNVGWTAPGEWLEYDIFVPAAGSYDLTSRVASNVAGRTFHIEIGAIQLPPLSAPARGWQVWEDRTYEDVALAAGNHTVRVVFDNGEVNFNYLNVSAAASSGCVEQALARTSASASSLETAQFGAALAIDGNAVTRWSSAFADPQWIYVNLGAPRRVSRVVLNWEAAASRNYDLEVSSDGSSWTVIHSDAAGNGGVDDITGLSAVGQYVRMYSRARTTPYGNSLFEFEVHGDPNPNCSSTGPSCTDGIQNGGETGVDCGGSCPPCTSGCAIRELSRASATASSQEGTYSAALAIDGRLDTRWGSAFSDPQWIAVDLGAPQRISRVLLNWEAAFSGNYDIEVRSSTSEAWTPVFSTTSGDGGSDDITGLSAVARYVRLYSHARRTAWGNSLWELRVFGDSSTCTASCVSQPTNSTPLTLTRSDVGVRQVIGNVGFGARLVRDPVSRKLHYMTIMGDIYQVDVQPGTASTSTRVITGAQVVAGMSPAVSPSTYQGLAFAPDGTMYVVLNVDGGTTNRAYVRRGTGTGSRTWTTVAKTDPYPDSNTPFDHHFSGIAVSPDGSSLLLTSGSRTDHGEVQSTGGVFPSTREVPLTAAMFRLPAAGAEITLANDTGTLLANGQLFATGLRNSYDPVFGPGGELFAGDNGPDADYSEELNAIRSGQHYGFPWRLGAEDNAQQFSGYDPANDPRLHPGFTAVDNGDYHNDPTFPLAPANLIDPIPNRGPDADQFRDMSTRGISDASDTGRSINTFTAHRVPLGLSFDMANGLCGDFQSKAFILSWGSAVPVFPDKGEDVLMLDVRPVGSSYEVVARQLATGLSRPIDSVLIGNKLYVLEYSDTGAGRLFEFTLPRAG